MASIKHSTPKVSAYSVYTRNKKLANASGIGLEHIQSITEVRTKSANADGETLSTRKRKAGAVENVNGTEREEIVVKGKRGRRKKIIIEKTPIENSHLAVADELETEEENDNICFKPSTSVNVSNTERRTVACGNEAAEGLFQWLLCPAKPDKFFEKKWEKKPFLIQRSKNNYYEGVFSTRAFQKIVEENVLNYDEEIDVVEYVDGERQPIKTDMKVTPTFLWNAYKIGYSIRMRNPQTYHKPLGSLCSLLQEYFSSYVGANMYLTPADSQGFPPHYDDIDAFILQIEGKKLWKLYTPNEKEELARLPSGDLNEDDIGEPCMEVELKAGDMLYFPRGYIHQAKSAPDMHSLHITLSTNQLNTWGDLIQQGLSSAMDLAFQNDVEFRKSIPKDYLDYVGHVYSDSDSNERKNFTKKALSLAKKVLDHFSTDDAADAHAIGFIHGSMPPFFSEKEKACSTHGNGTRIFNGKAEVAEKLTLKTKVRLIRRRAFRLVADDDSSRLFHSLSNSKNHKEGEERFIDVSLDNTPVIIALFKNHPEYTAIKDLPHRKSESLLDFVQELYDFGFLMTEEPLPFEE